VSHGMRQQHLRVDRHEAALRERLADLHGRVAEYVRIMRP
jgi:hypothetical protein